MPYIGKPQSSDPITVNASNIEDGSIIAADISSSLGCSPRHPKVLKELEFEN